MAQYLRSDHGTEYKTRAFKEYCKRTGVNQQFTSLYTPQQNEMLKTAGKTVMDTTKCFLAETGLPKRVYGELAI